MRPRMKMRFQPPLSLNKNAWPFFTRRALFSLSSLQKWRTKMQRDLQSIINPSCLLLSVFQQKYSPGGSLATLGARFKSHSNVERDLFVEAFQTLRNDCHKMCHRASTMSYSWAIKCPVRHLGTGKSLASKPRQGSHGGRQSFSSSSTAPPLVLDLIFPVWFMRGAMMAA